MEIMIFMTIMNMKTMAMIGSHASSQPLYRPTKKVMLHHFKIAVESPSNAGKGMNDENAISNTLNNVDTGITARSEDNENNDNHSNDRKMITIEI